MTRPQSAPSLLFSIGRIAGHWRPATVAFAAMFGLIALIAFLLPNEYQSRVKILVKNARVNPMVSLDQQTQGVLYVDEVSEARINTEIELLTSNDVLSEVVTQCHLGDLVKSSAHDPAARNNIALGKLQKDLSVSAVRKSDIIEVSYRSPDPRRSAAVVRALSEDYLRAHLKLHGSPDSSNFFLGIAADYAAQLKATEQQLADFRQAHQILALPEEKTLALEQSTELEKLLAANTAQTQWAKTEANHLRDAVDHTPSTIEKERRSLPNQNSAEQISLLLLALQNKRSEAMERYLPGDRIVTGLDSQIAQSKAALESARAGTAQEVTSGSNPTFFSAQDQYIRSSADFNADAAQTRELNRELGVNRARLVALDEATVPYEELERRTTQLQDLSDFYKKKGDEASVNDRLDKERISNVTVAEHAFQAEVPSSPRRGLILSLGFLWSLLIGVVTAFVGDFLDDRVSSVFELEQVPGLPLLAALPIVALAPSFNGAFPAVYLSMKRLDRDLMRSES